MRTSTTPAKPEITYRRREPEAGALHRFICANLEDFRREIREAHDGLDLPDWIAKAFAGYVKCGQLGHGSLRFHCPGCRKDQIVAFSCKVRGLCPSCDGKRMVEESAHLVDSVIPQVPIRQWVLTLPYALRYILAWHLPARTAVLGAFMRAITRHYRKRAKRQGIDVGHIGAVSVCQRFNSALDLDLHWHVLVSDGLWHESHVRTHFWHAPPLKDAEVAAVLDDAETRILRQMKKFGWNDDLPTIPHDPLETKNPVLATCMRGAMSEARLKEKPPQMREKGARPPPRPSGRNCCHADGFSLHANTRVAPTDRKRLEQMAKYLCRPAISAERLELLPNNEVRVKLKTAWRDGTESVRYSAVQFLLRLAAIIPLPHRPAIIYHGAFAPNHSWRARVVLAGEHAPGRRNKERPQLLDLTDPLGLIEKATKLTWSEALKRAFCIDILTCECGQRLKLLAVIPAGPEAARFLRHLKLPAEPNDIDKVRGPPEVAEPPDDLEDFDPDPGDDIDLPFFDEFEAAA
jgi:hypothetical protein